MNIDKQIEEMARDVCTLVDEYENCENCDSELDIGGDPCIYKCMAKLFANKGYRKASDVAREIFEGMLNEIDKAIDFTADSRRIRFELCQQKDIDPYKDRFFNVFDGKYNCVLGFGKYIAELKKKYTEGEG